MPDLRNRDKYENELNAAVAVMFNRWVNLLEYEGRLITLRANRSDIREIEKPLIKVGLIGAKQVSKIVGVPWDGMMEVVATENIRETVVAPIIQLIEDTTNEKIRSITLSEFGLEAFGKFREVMKKIKDTVLTASRSLTIAVTEITRSLTMGENFAFRQWTRVKQMLTGRSGDADEKFGVEEIFDFEPDDMAKPKTPFKIAFSAKPIWVTEQDDAVCGVCGPLHGKPADTWGQFDSGPPAHPVCRCFINYEVDN